MAKKQTKVKKIIKKAKKQRSKRASNQSTNTQTDQAFTLPKTRYLEGIGRR
ncbi:MAG: hypothetical protein GF390_00410, partial [Candidatus Pacebacteria bacterium]|nr:hypothetical protein [Candidatus Paceibacterota bacterium]